VTLARGRLQMGGCARGMPRAGGRANERERDAIFNIPLLLQQTSYPASP
jgi:hypothetical protein